MKNPLAMKPPALNSAVQRNRVEELEADDRRQKETVTRGGRVEFLLDGCPVQAFEGESISAALLAIGKRVLRTTSRLGEHRGIYCGIGICFDCVMTVDGRPNVRTCQTAVRAGMRVDSQSGNGTWRVEA